MTMPITKRISTALLFPALFFTLAAVQSPHALAFAPAPAFAPSNDTSAYGAGMRAMNEHRWQDAITAFDKVAAAKDKRAAAALYWKAYSLNKLQRPSDATAVCNTLRGQYADSSWNKDCAALAISNRDIRVNLDDKIRRDIDIHVHPDVHIDPIVIPDFHFDFKNNPEIKILALNSLLNQDPAKAVPQLRDILSGNQSMGIKKHAIFILAQSKSPEAQSVLHDAVTGKMGPELQRQAIMMMAIFRRQSDNATFAEVYKTTTDPQIKKAIIMALFISHDAPHLVELARSEKDLELKRNIVSQLAIMHDKAATDYMMELLK